MSSLDSKTLNDQYEDSKNHMRQFFQPLDEFERLARNRPHPSLDPQLPKTTDGTLAAIIQEQPKRVLQQIPTGKVDCTMSDAYAEIAGKVLTTILDPMSRTQGNVLQKSWNMVGKALTYGVQPSYTYFTNTGEKMHTDFIIPYIKDVIPERGKVFAPDSNYTFLRAWYTKADIQAIIDKEERLMKKSKSYKPEWDLKMLAKLKDMGSKASKDTDARTPAEKEKGVEFEGIELIHAFQKGVGEKFYTFSPSLNKEDSNLLRTKKNPDPRGEMPIDWLYCNIDLSNPLGRGAVEMSGGVQNLIDQQMVMFQFMSTMMMGPPLQLWGNVNKATIKFRPNAIWDMGSNPTNKIEPYAVNNNAMANFPTNYGLLKSQILNLNSSLDTSVSAESGNPGFSKTPAGVKAGKERLSISDNYMRKQYETWRGEQAETALNIFFAEMEGNDKLELKQDDISQTTIDTLGEFYDEKTDSIMIPYSKIKDTRFSYTVDASSSQEEQDTENVQNLTTAMELAIKIPDPQIQQTIPALYKAIVREIGIKGFKDIFPDKGTPSQLNAEANAPEILDPAMASQIAQQTGTPMGQVGGMGQPPEQAPPPPDPIKEGALQLKTQEFAHKQQMDKAKLQLEIQKLAQAQQAQTQQGEEQPQEDAPLDAEEQQFVQALLQQGIDETTIEQVIVMLRQDMPAQQIMQSLNLGVQNG